MKLEGCNLFCLCERSDCLWTMMPLIVKIHQLALLNIFHQVFELLVFFCFLINLLVRWLRSDSNTDCTHELICVLQDAENEII